MNLPPGNTNRAARKGPPPPPKPPKRAPIKTVPVGEELMEVPVSESGLGAYHSTSQETQQAQKQEEEIKSEQKANVEQRQSLSHENTLVNEATSFNLSSTGQKDGGNLSEQGNFNNDNEKEKFTSTQQQLATQNVQVERQAEAEQRFVPPAPRKPIAPPSKKAGGAVQGRKPMNVPKPPAKTTVNESLKEVNQIPTEESNKLAQSHDQEIKEQDKIGNEQQQKQNEKQLQYETPRKDLEEEPLFYQPPSVNIKSKVNAPPPKPPTTVNEKSSSRKVTEMKNKLKDHSMRRDKLLQSCSSEQQREDEGKLQNEVHQNSHNPFDQQIAEPSHLLADENEQFQPRTTNAVDLAERDNYNNNNQSNFRKEEEQKAFEPIHPNHQNFRISQQKPEVDSNSLDGYNQHISNKNNDTNNQQEQTQSELILDQAHQIHSNNGRVSNHHMPLVSQNLKEQEASNTKEDGKIQETQIREVPQIKKAPIKHKPQISSEKVINQLKNLQSLSEGKQKVEVFQLIESFSAQKQSYLKNAQELTKLCQQNRYEQEKKITIINELLAKLEEQNIRLHSILMQS